MSPRIQIRLTGRMRQRHTDRERETEKTVNSKGKVTDTFILWGLWRKNITSLQGSQPTPARPSVRSNINMKM